MASGGGEHQLEDILAKISNMGALKFNVLINEPGGKCLDRILLAGVTASLDVARHFTGESVDAGAAHDVGAKGADRKKGSSHGWVVVTDVMIAANSPVAPCCVPLRQLG